MWRHSVGINVQFHRTQEASQEAVSIQTHFGSSHVSYKMFRELSGHSDLTPQHSSVSGLTDFGFITFKMGTIVLNSQIMWKYIVLCTNTDHSG